MLRYCLCLPLLLLSLLSGCSVVEAPVDLATTTVSTTGKVACAAFDATGTVASAVGDTASGVATVSRAAADVVTSPLGQNLAMGSQGGAAGTIAKSLPTP